MTVIEVKPRKWGWCVFESPGVEPVFPAEAARAWLPPFGAYVSTHGRFIRMGQGMTEVQIRYQSNFRLATDIESVALIFDH
jgi:hypothetical protein